MIHSGQKNMSQPPKNHEMLKLYAFNSSLTNSKEQCNSRVSQHNSKHHANVPTPPPSRRKTRAAREQRLSLPLQIIHACHPGLAQVISPAQKKAPDAASYPVFTLTHREW